jgi:flavin reductase (DIM6/NTAB) family NADH-FMN oxidoreductase RutF
MTQTDLRQGFLDGMSLAAASVSIVTTDGPAGRNGVTVSAMTPVSADGDAPTLLVCLNALAPTLPNLLENGCFCVNVLKIDQAQVSDVFSGRTPAPGNDKFNIGAFSTAPSGAPRFDAALVSFDCRLVSAEKIGSHHICIGSVEDVSVASDGTPLLYGLRSYLRAERH